ncbi:FRG domain-containing protein [Peribacillus frigoritolerans]|nr:FRG domain-containing protein [Peribacillus frigoritolerans]
MINFNAELFHYMEKPPEIENTLEWLSLIQHHGGPTRLLDISLIHIMWLCIFSIDQASQESAVFCLNKDLIYKKRA